MNNMELAWLILTSPRVAFMELRERPRFLFPMVLTLASTVAVLVWYYLFVDFPWLAEHMLSANERLQQMPEAQRTKAMAMMSKPVLMGSSIIGGVVAIMVFRVLEAGYYSLAGKITNVQYSFRHWFALSWWTSLPHLLGVVVMAGFLLLASSNQIGNEELQLLSLNELFFHRSMQEPGFTLLSNLTILHPWAWLLTVIGIRAWSGRSLLFSALFALTPIVLIYGGWALIALR
jgi:hypothetical protein